MERSEPSLAPEWLRNAGNGPGGGTSNHHVSSSQSDGPLPAFPRRNRSSNSSNSNDPHRSSFLGRSLSSNSRRGSDSNGLLKHDKNYSRSYNSFNKNHRDRDKQSEVTDRWDNEFSDTSRINMPGRIENDPLRRSQSMLSRVHDDVLPRRISGGSSLVKNEYSNVPPLLGPAGVQKVPFERDFPSLVPDERPITPELSRVPSPGLNRGVQSIPVANSMLSTVDTRISALADVPTEVGSNNSVSSPSLQPAAPTLGTGATSTTGGRNMAEALVGPSMRSLPSETSVQKQKLEELAVIQSKRLIPMTHTLPKSLVLNPSDKLKPKTAARSTEPAVSPKNGYVRAELPKTAQTTKLQVLKSGLENGVHPVSKDVLSPTAIVNKNVNLQSTGTPSIAPVLSKNPINHKLAGDRKAQAQSRTDFFNSVRKRSMNSTSLGADSSPVLSSPTAHRSDEEHRDVASNPASPCAKNCANRNGDATTLNQASLFASDEEKVFAFMRSLGWKPEPDSDDDEALTEDEIREFCEKYMKIKPASRRLQAVLQRLPSKFEETHQNDEHSESNPTDSTS